MGGLIGIPARMAASCLGSCVAFSFFRLADTGTVKTMTAVRCVLAWLQVFGAALAWTASSSPKGWIETTCDKLYVVGYGDLGVCACRGRDEEEACFSDQLAFRATAATALVFIALLVFALSGCALGAARYHETGKFLGLFVLWAMSLVVPNDAFSTFAVMATAVSCVFVLVQSVIVLDTACSWHDRWYTDYARGPDKKLHEAAIIATSAAFVLGAIALAVALWCATSSGLAHGVLVGAEVLSIALLHVSITDWCEHGTLLTPSVMMLYNTWLVHEAFVSMCPAEAGDHRVQVLPPWFGLVLCAATVLLLAQGLGFDAESTETPLPQQALLPTSSGDVTITRATSGMSDSDTRSFIVHCAVHIAVPMYIASSLVKQGGAGEEGCGASFVVHVATAFASQLLYGWHLVAPMVLTSRRF